MATEVIDIKINGAQAAASIKELKSSLKELKDELLNVPAGSSEFKKLSQAINDTEGKIGDLTDSFNTLKGSGIERTKASLGLLREGFQNFDFEKIKAGFSGMGAAMSAVPIFLLVEGFKLLIENFDKVVKFGKELFNVFSDEERAVKKLNAELEHQKEVTSRLTKELQREIEVMEAQGKSHSKILAKKKELIDAQIQEAVVTAKLNLAKIREVQSNDSITDSINRVTASLLRKIGQDKAAEAIEVGIQKEKNERNKENVKALNDSLELIKDLKNKEKIEVIKLDNEIATNKKKNHDDEKQREKDRQAREADVINAQIDAEEKAAKKKAEDKKKQDEANEEFLKGYYDREKKRLDDSVAKNKKAEEQKAKDAEAILNSSLNSAKALSDAFFGFQLARAKGNAEQEKKIRKQMFEVDKAFNVARAIQDGIRSVQAALTLPPPAGQILAGVNAATAALNVAKILATKFEPGATAEADTIDVPKGNAPQIPQLNTSAPTTQPTTLFDQNGKNLSIVARVYEGEMTSAQKRQTKLEEQATI